MQQHPYVEKKSKKFEIHQLVWSLSLHKSWSTSDNQSKFIHWIINSQIALASNVAKRASTRVGAASNRSVGSHSKKAKAMAMFLSNWSAPLRVCYCERFTFPKSPSLGLKTFVFFWIFNSGKSTCLEKQLTLHGRVLIYWIILTDCRRKRKVFSIGIVMY